MSFGLQCPKRNQEVLGTHGLAEHARGPSRELKIFGCCAPASELLTLANLGGDVCCDHEQKRAAERRCIVPGRHLFDMVSKLAAELRRIFDCGPAIWMHGRR